MQTLSFHANQRMNQRGITQRQIEMVLKYGDVRHDYYFLNKRMLHRIIDDCHKALAKTAAHAEIHVLQQDLKILKQILDKGGLVVVECENTIITCYQYDSHKNRKNFH